MKLIELLVQKTLTGEFKWPKRASQIFQDYDSELRPDAEMSRVYLDPVAENHRICGVPFDTLGESHIVTREQYEAALAAAQQPVWNGEGLPPVGTECEYTKETLPGDEWTQCTVDYVGASFVVYRDCYGVELTGIIGDIKFRPIRSEAEKKREAAITAILDDMRTIPCDLDLRDEAAVIYDAIAAGKIPGVKLDVRND